MFEKIHFPASSHLKCNCVCYSETRDLKIENSGAKIECRNITSLFIQESNRIFLCGSMEISTGEGKGKVEKILNPFTYPAPRAWVQYHPKLLSTWPGSRAR